MGGPAGLEGLDGLNRRPREDVLAALLTCARLPRWAAEVADARPYAAVDDVLRVARDAASPWTAQEVDAALAGHPRIGERAAGAGAEARMSASEQAVVADAADDVQQAIAAGNVAYERRFGHVFLIRAAGRTPEEILAALTERMLNDPVREREIAVEQLRDIALLRLQGILAA